MRCKTCDYRLWNIRSRQCPECGAAFRPSDFEFVPNSVQFRCPHCDQAYYGTGPKGHLVPIEFDCVACRRHIHMDEMLLLPTEGIQEEQTQTELLPWLNRRQLGGAKAWFRTVVGAMTSPARMMGMLPPNSSTGQAWWFAVLTNIVSFLGFLPLVALSIIMPLVIMRRFAGPGPLAGLLGLGGILGACVGIALMLAGCVFLITATVLIWGAVSHGLLRLLGATASGIGRTIQAICYSSGANAITAIPCLGLYFGWAWWLFSAVLMVARGQRVSGARAAFAVTLLPATCLVTLAGLFWALLWPQVTAMSSLVATTTGPAGVRQISMLQVQTLQLKLKAYAVRHAGCGPAHAAELLDPEEASPYLFIAHGSQTKEDRVPMSNTTLQRCSELSPAGREKRCRAAAEQLPKSTIAHRLGDYVFTYHGIDLINPPDPKLWVVILSPDPAFNASGAGLGTVIVAPIGRTDAELIATEEFSNRLAEQNVLRAKCGLAPLPDPNTITHARPATASAPAASESSR